MPQDKRRQRSAELPDKGPSRKVAKAGAVTPVKRTAAKTELKAKLQVQKATVKVPAKLSAKLSAIEKKSTKLTNKVTAKAAAKPAKKRSRHSVADAQEPTVAAAAVKRAIKSKLPRRSAHGDLKPVAEQPPIIETTSDLPPDADGFGPVSGVGNSGAESEAAVGLAAGNYATDPKTYQADRSSNKPSVERRIKIKSLFERRRLDPFAQERRKVDPAGQELKGADSWTSRIAALVNAVAANAAAAAAPENAAPETEPAVPETAVPATVSAVPVTAAVVSEKEHAAADSVKNPRIERRKTNKSLLERRLVDSSAKERRGVDPLSNKVVVPLSRSGFSAKQRTSETVVAIGESAMKDNPAAQIREAAQTAEPSTGRTSTNQDRNWGGKGAASEFAEYEQKNLFNETTQWMRRGASVLIGLNALVLLIVLMVWRSHASQQAQIKQMQATNAAAMAQMKQATTAWEGAESALLLKNQTVQSIPTQSKLSEAQLAPSASAVRMAAARAQAAQIEFHVEKTTGLNVHMPVLFHLGVENVGKSSALNAKVWGVVKVIDSNKEPNFKYDAVVLTKEAIAPTDSETTLVLYTANDGLVVPLKEDEFWRIRAGSAYVVAYGKIVYEDVYGVRHWAVFCHAITEPVGMGTQLKKCQAYNSTGVRDAAEPQGSTPNSPQNTASLMLPATADFKRKVR